MKERVITKTQRLNDSDLNPFKDLIIYNDNFNTFDHVIETLIKICKHNVLQAEQCTHIIHHKGKCVVKSGELHELLPMRKAILQAQLKVKIQ